MLRALADAHDGELVWVSRRVGIEPSPVPVLLAARHET